MGGYEFRKGQGALSHTLPRFEIPRYGEQVLFFPKLFVGVQTIHVNPSAVTPVTSVV